MKSHHGLCIRNGHVGEAAVCAGLSPELLPPFLEMLCAEPWVCTCKGLPVCVQPTSALGFWTASHHQCDQHDQHLSCVLLLVKPWMSFK